MENTCLICHSPATEIMNGDILGKYNIHYYFCKKCKCVFTEKPYWISEAYNSSIAATDTGIMLRNLEIGCNVFSIIKRYFNPNIKVVDYGGGYGILTRMLRDKGVDAYWSDKYSENLVAKGFEYDGTSKVDVMLAFEVFEHLENPMETIREIMSKSDCFIFSVATLPKFDFSTNQDWWYFTPETGQHIFFPSQETLKWIANEIGCRYYKILGLHIFSRQKKFSIICRLDLIFCWTIYQIRKKFFRNRRFVSKVWEDNATIKNKLMK
jgi:hypothetical protein